MAVSMPVRRHGAGDVDQVHEASAQQVAERVGIVGQYHLCHLRLRFAHRASLGSMAVIGIHIHE